MGITDPCCKKGEATGIVPIMVRRPHPHIHLMTDEDTPMMQAANTANAHPTGGNQLFPLSPKAIRLLRAHDAETSDVASLSKGTGETTKTPN